MFSVELEKFDCVVYLKDVDEAKKLMLKYNGTPNQKLKEELKREQIEEIKRWRNYWKELLD